MKKNILNILLIAIFGILISGCTKEIVGPQGPAGQDGEDGNANIKTSNYSNLSWYDVNTTTIGVTLNVPNITQDIVNNGTIKVALSPDATYWMDLPRNWGTTTWWYTYTIGKVNIAIYAPSGVSNDLKYGYAKVTVIAGN